MPTISISPNGQLEPRAHSPAGAPSLIASFKNDIMGQTTTLFGASAKVMHGATESAHDGVTTHYHWNQQYSVTALSDSSGNVSERYAYTAYGQPTFLNASGAVQKSSAASNRYTYTGREWDATLGLYHFRARRMSGLTGRFLTRDPIGYVDGEVLYQFVTSKPLNSLDPSGLICWQFCVPGANPNQTPTRTNPLGPFGPPVRRAVTPRLHPQGRGTVAIDFDATPTKRCIFYASSFPGLAGIDDVPTNGGVKVPFTNQDNAIQAIKDSGCCEVIFAGHQGGSGSDGNPGGVDGMINCNPPDDFGRKLKDAFRSNGCNGACSLVLASCGAAVPGSSNAPDVCRQKLANDSGCEIFGSQTTVIYYDRNARYPSQQNCNLDFKSRGTTCDGTWSNWRDGIRNVPWSFRRYESID